MRWPVVVAASAHRDKNRLLRGLAFAGSRRIVGEMIARAFGEAANDPWRRCVPYPGNRWWRLLDVEDIRLILDLNLRNVANPEEDLVCCVIGVMMRPPG